MGTFILLFNLLVLIIFTVCYSYQLFYVFAVFARKPKALIAKKNHRYAVLISGRNESLVIGNLIDSVKAQDYPSELVDTFVIADNCTDDTADVARSHGAIVFERDDQVKRGKSWALDYAIKRIFSEYADGYYDGFFVFDADNVVDSHFITEMNKSFDNGFRIVTSYRNSKNFDSSWVSAASSLWFLREGKYLSQARSVLGNASCLISGTGFLISREIFERDGGWTHHLLTEDIEFSVDNILQGERIGYAPHAIVYDEQPITFKASWDQRMRWSRGFYQVLVTYGGRLFRRATRGSFACFDAFMTIAPAMILSLLSVVVNAGCLFFGFLDLSLTDEITMACTTSIMMTAVNFYFMFFLFAVLTTITERDQIHASRKARIKNVFTFPLFMFTYLPIALIAMFKKVEWKPIAHTVVISAAELSADDASAQEIRA